MKSSAPQVPLPVEIFRILRDHPRRWLLPAAAIAICTFAFAGLRDDTWVASQALVVRDEATGNVNHNRPKPGSFTRLEEMTTRQMTILELVRNAEVLKAVLVEVGPPADSNTAEWPTIKHVDSFRKRVQLAPPKGAEFGMTEVFYLQVKDSDQQRATRLVASLCNHLESSLQEFRRDQAASMIGELELSAKLAQEEVSLATARLTHIESQVGADLAELRILEKSPSGNSELRKKFHLIETDLRTFQLQQAANTHLRTVLVSAQNDPSQLLATPNPLLESQPALRRLKDGLVDTQLLTAHLTGRMSKTHPDVQTAVAAERQIARQLQAEIEVAVRGIDIDLKMGASRVSLLQNQFAETKDRLERLAGVRAEYSVVIDSVLSRTRVLRSAEENLAEARSNESASQAASLISRIGSPDTGSRPVGASRKMICAIGILAGLLAGAGFAVLVTPTGQQQVEAPAPAQPVAPKATPQFTSERLRESARSAPVNVSGALKKIADAPMVWN